MIKSGNFSLEMGDCSKIRNICILAHVDHGKTTLADHLIAACGGGVLHPKLAGRLRFLDYLDEEQRRAITMKSSSISLQFQSFSINLIDSPGHMDFCSEVSTAVRMSDGALILVDAVEGIHIQTHAVLRQAWVEKLTPCLVLNKIDRLITELKLSPMEAYTKLQRIVQEVNAIISAYRSEKYLSDVDSLLSSEISEVSEEDDEFQPQKGNVAFACALDGWGFTLGKFAEIYASKLGASPQAILKGLWGPRFYDAKKKMIVGKKANLSNSPPMFVQFVLAPLWQLYNAAMDDRPKLESLIKSLNLSIPPRELLNKDPKLVVQSVMSRWLPLADSVLSMVVNCIPNPVAAQSFRISRLMPQREKELERETAVRRAVEACDSSDEAPSIAFVSKMFAVPLKLLPELPEEEDEDSGECFLAFARVFSGKLASGQSIYVLSSMYDPNQSDVSKHIQRGEIKSLYLMMGQGLKKVDSIGAGNVVAIRGLGREILKSATLSSTPNCYPFSSLMFQVAPMLKVAIEPSDPADMAALNRGLRLLDRADPFVEVTVSSRGEHVLAAAGEVHLQRCVKDLKERFAKVSLEVSPPLVSFRETIEGDEDSSLKFLVNGGSAEVAVERKTPNGRCLVRAQVVKLPDLLTKALDEEKGDLKARISNTLEREKAENLIERIWARAGPNILVAPTEKPENEELGMLITKEENSQNLEVESLKSSIVSGFQLATSAGPLCEEPMWGLAFIVEVFLLPGSQQQDLHGQTMAAVKEACRAAVLKSSPRLVEGMYFCELSTTTEHLGAMYAVLSRRRARVLKEEMQEGSPRFTVHAYVPVAESFGFADELRRWTSGAASALLVLSHWEVIMEDPFFVPKTEEEVEEFGDGASVPHNTARKLVDSVRRRKGLSVEEKVVRYATKQRTLARKV